jgi:hypothetical protein
MYQTIQYRIFKTQVCNTNGLPNRSDVNIGGKLIIFFIIISNAIFKSLCDFLFKSLISTQMEFSFIKSMKESHILKIIIKLL